MLQLTVTLRLEVLQASAAMAALQATDSALAAAVGWPQSCRLSPTFVMLAAIHCRSFWQSGEVPVVLQQSNVLVTRSAFTTIKTLPLKMLHHLDSVEASPTVQRIMDDAHKVCWAECWSSDSGIAECCSAELCSRNHSLHDPAGICLRNVLSACKQGHVIIETLGC